MEPQRRRSIITRCIALTVIVLGAAGIFNNLRNNATVIKPTYIYISRASLPLGFGDLEYMINRDSGNEAINFYDSPFNPFDKSFSVVYKASCACIIEIFYWKGSIVPHDTYLHLEADGSVSVISGETVRFREEYIKYKMDFDAALSLRERLRKKFADILPKE